MPMRCVSPLAKSVLAILTICLGWQAYAGEVELLGENTTWRAFWCLKAAEQRVTIAAPENWAQPEFDDLSWATTRTLLPGYGCENRKEIQEIPAFWLRGRFTVTDPLQVKGLSLEVSVRGGVCVFLNGQELGRKGLPAGTPVAGSAAEAYPPETYFEPDGKTLLGSADVPAEKNDDRYQKRLRTLKVDVPTTALRKGVNVLALVLCRAPHSAEMLKQLPAENPPLLWNTLGLHRLRLAAPTLTGLQDPAVLPDGVRVWNASTMSEIGGSGGSGDAGAALSPMVLSGPRNGWSSGVVVISSEQPLKGLSAKVSDLKSGGGTIPASAIKVYFARRAEGATSSFDALSLTPPEEAMLLPVWVWVQVGKDTAPGKYEGNLDLTGLPQPVRVPVTLTVFDYLLPDPRAWQFGTTCFESPETIAAYYKVPLWSEEHCQKLETSLQLLGQLGDRMLTVPVLANSILGQEPLLVFRKEGEKYVPEFKDVERYFKLYTKHCGAPDVVALQVWDAGGLDGTPLVEVQDGQRTLARVPPFGGPGTEELWKAVIEGMKKRVKDMGWKEEVLLLGIIQDAWPADDKLAFLKPLAGDLGWFQYSHLQDSPVRSLYTIHPDEQGGFAQSPGWVRPYLRGHPSSFSARGQMTDVTAAAAYRVRPFTTVLHGFNALGAWGFDSWLIASENGQKKRRLYDNSQYRHWARLVRYTVRTLTTPGPEGALPTVRFEMLREGMQETEALSYVELNKENAKLTPELKARCAALRKSCVDSRLEAIAALDRPTDLDWNATKEALFQAAGEIQKQLK